MAAELTGQARLTTALTRTENSAVSGLRGTRARLAALGAAYSAADTEVTVNRTRIRGGMATVQVTDTTTLTYEKIRGDEPATTGFKAHHRLTFTARPDGTWTLTALRSTDKGPREINEPVTTATSKRNPPRSSTRPGSPSATRRPRTRRSSRAGRTTTRRRRRTPRSTGGTTTPRTTASIRPATAPTIRAGA